MNQVRLVADSSCDLLTLSGMDFVSVPLTMRSVTPTVAPTVPARTWQTGRRHSAGAAT